MEQDQEQQQVQKTDDIFAQRLAKLNDLYAAGAQPYGSRVDNITSSADAKAKSFQAVKVNQCEPHHQQ